MDNVTVNIFLALLISFVILSLGYLGIMLFVVPYWDKKEGKQAENNTNSASIKKKRISPGQHVSSLEQDGIYYKPYFDKEKGLYISMVDIYITAKTNPLSLTQHNIIYYQQVPFDVLSDIHNHFAEEINQALIKNNKETNKENKEMENE